MEGEVGKAQEKAQAQIQEGMCASIPNQALGHKMIRRCSQTTHQCLARRLRKANNSLVSSWVKSLLTGDFG